MCLKVLKHKIEYLQVLFYYFRDFDLPSGGLWGHSGVRMYEKTDFVVSYQFWWPLNHSLNMFDRLDTQNRISLDNSQRSLLFAPTNRGHLAVSFYGKLDIFDFLSIHMTLNDKIPPGIALWLSLFGPTLSVVMEVTWRSECIKNRFICLLSILMTINHSLNIYERLFTQDRISLDISQ